MSTTLAQHLLAAHHAAGHAVAAFAMGLKPHAVTLDGSLCGYTPSRRLRSRRDDYARIAMLAGPLAEVACSHADLTEAITRCCDGWHPRQGRGAYFDPSGSFWTEIAYEYLTDNEAGHEVLAQELLITGHLRSAAAWDLLERAA